MHLDHDHIGSSAQEHTHEYTHSHPHDHEHDHHTHDHGDDHPHTHSYTHTHEHGGEPHTHENQEHCASDCSSCGGCGHTPMDELIAMMKYMVGHNTSHANELAQLARQLDEAGNHAAYEQVMQAVADFEKGNLRLSTVLTALGK